MKKVLVITYYWPPAGGAGVQRCLKFVKYMPYYAVEPIVLTVDPEIANYPIRDMSLEKDMNKDLKIYKTYAKDYFKWYKKLSKNKTLLHGAYLNELKKDIKSKIVRYIRGNLFIPDPRRGWNKYAFKKACEIIEKEKIHTIITSSPPHSTQLIGLRLKKKYMTINWIADLRDPWTDVFYYKKFNHNFIAKAIDKNYERKVFQNADKMVVVSEAIKNLFKNKRTMDPENSVCVIPNGFDHEDFENVEVQKKKEFTITYTGTIATEYNITGFLNAIRKILKPLDNKIFIRFYGTNKELVYYFNIKDIEDKIQVYDYVPHNKAIKHILNSDLLLLIIPEKKLNKGVLTGKLFEYLATRKPIICVGTTDCEAGNIIKECEAGMTFEYNDEEGMVEYLKKIMECWKEGKSPLPLNDIYKKYSRLELTKKLTDLIIA